ncbi:gamma-glutamylcyclotransferase [Vibrio sp. CAU 1672]|uniref:gamma-glutamylcyclotransferase family protein n=1 Tax=Vibrio sp. CAU 1672 TaxID=3032594 RepID=UPI0023DB4214|nr:gamma-glutamylcyclotransferase [Vibrio sp. CAU 1672]MDF2153206.1 gamma-glutamylcyclotransferase [Vibrio sp. CAU 1672]
MQHLVFVYGTLRQGESNHHFLRTAQFLGHHETDAQFALYDLGLCPAVSHGQRSILGEVYLIDDETLHALDKLEDVPVEYRRESISTPFGQAWIYLYQDSELLNEEIASGDWCQRV